MTGEVDLGIDGLGDYHELGSGGFATVYSASDDRAGRRVAVKVLNAVDAAGRRRFERECRTMGRTTGGPNIVQLFGHGYTPIGDRPYLILEHLDRGSLRERLDSSGPLPVAEAVEVTLAVAEALEFAHSVGVVHKDVKPANILVSGRGVVKLSDFGIAAIKEATHGTQLAVSYRFAPPEAFTAEVDPTSGHAVDPRDERSDLYSLAATLHALVTGEPPFRASNQVALMRQILEEPPPPTGHPGLDRFLARAMAKDPAARHRNAAEFAEDLRLVEVAGELGRDPATAPYPTAPAPTPTPTPRPGRGRLILVAAVAVAAVAIGLAALVLRDPDGNAPAGADEGSTATLESAAGETTSTVPTSEPVVYTGHRDRAGDPEFDGVVALAALDGGRIASGGNDGSVQIWSPDDPSTTIATATGHDGAVLDLATLPDGLLASAGADGTVRVWDPAEPDRTVWIHRGPEDPGGDDDVLSLAVLGDGRVVSGGADGTAQVWRVGDVEDDAGADADAIIYTGHRDRADDPRSDGVFALAVLGDGRVVSGGGDGSVQVWWPDQPERTPTIHTGHTSRVLAVLVLSDGRIASGDLDGIVHVWDPDDPDGPIVVNRDHRDRVLALVEPTAGVVASSSGDGTVRLWSAEDGSEVAPPYTDHRDDATDPDEDGVGALLMLDDGRIASASADGTVQVWSW